MSLSDKHSTRTPPREPGHSSAGAQRHRSGRGSSHAGRTKPIRLVAIDLDGTLLSSRKTITRETHTAIRAAIKAGIHVVIATARPPRSVRFYYEALKLETPTINYNGALIWDEKRRKAIEHVPLNVEVAKRVIAWGRRKYPELLVSVEILDKWYTDHFEDLPQYMTETAKQFAPDFIGPLGAFMRVPITKLMLLGSPAASPSWSLESPRSSSRRYRRRVRTHMLQLMNPTTSKAGALARVAKELGIAASEVMAIGDAPNDVQMLEWAGLAVVPENAWEAAKKVADAVVPSNDADGVWWRCSGLYWAEEKCGMSE